jgi:hypothetical protein
LVKGKLMNYPTEVKIIFHLTLNLLEKDEQFDRQLLEALRELCDEGKLDNAEAIETSLEQITALGVTSNE